MSDVCGTDAGYQRHRRAGEDPCDPCKEARRNYVRSHRAKRGGIADSSRRLERARGRAHVRLSEMYPRVFARLLAEELATTREVATHRPPA